MKPSIVTPDAYGECVMPMNRIQFQAGLSMKEFQQQYGTEAQCKAALVASRWPMGRSVVDARARATSASTTTGDCGNA